MKVPKSDENDLIQINYSSLVKILTSLGTHEIITTAKLATNANKVGRKKRSRALAM
jgi:hypothetical protein